MKRERQFGLRPPREGGVPNGRVHTIQRCTESGCQWAVMVTADTEEELESQAMLDRLAFDHLKLHHAQESLQ